MNDRTDMDEPKCTQSNTLKLEPILLIPYIDSEDPIRTKLRNEIEEPNVLKSRTESYEPNLLYP